MKNIKENYELVAPAGNLEKAKTVLAFGADAVYLGIPDYSLRARVNDFTVQSIEEAAELCRRLDKKIYITLNIFAHNKHLESLRGHIKTLKDMGVDAIILSDPGVMSLVKEIWPRANIHLSTQANCTNWRAAEFWGRQGVKRVILGRETSLKEIKEISKKCPWLELEYFVHGAMCMAYSGRCFLSKYYQDRSANLGDCAQPCRWEYAINRKSPDREDDFLLSAKGQADRDLELVEEEHGSYILNSKDLCLVRHLDELKEAGISSFKIEGRAKSVYYQAVVAGIYRQALDIIHDKSRGKEFIKKEISKLFKDLNTKLVHRGYTTGFLFNNKADQNLACSHNKCDWEFCGQVIKSNPSVSSAKNKKQPVRTIVAQVSNTIKKGDRLEIVYPIYGIIKLTVDKLLDDKTKNEISEAHGGQGQRVVLGYNNELEIPLYSVIRRKIKKL